MNPTWHIQIEGGHGFGKDTLANKLAELTNRLHSLHVRGPISDWAFSKLHGRHDYDIYDVAGDWSELPNFLLVVLEPSNWDQHNALFRAKHPDATYTNAELYKLIDHAADAYRNSCCRVLQLRAFGDVTEMANRILAEIEA